MKGENSADHSRLLLSLDLGGNANDVPALPQWFQCQQADRNYNNCFYQQNSAFSQEVPPSADLLGSTHSGVNNSMPMVNGVSEIHTEILYSNVTKACCSKPAGSFPFMDNHKVGYVRPLGESESWKEPTSTHSQTFAQNCTSRGENLSEHRCNILRGKVAAQSVPSKLRNSEAKHRSYATDRRRKIKVAERIGALRELLPHPQEAGEEYILEDIIDHIKNLQRQIKELSTSRLRGESAPDPLVFLEGHGHYLPNGQTLDSSSLEEVMGHFLEENPIAATQFLESRGLLLMPMELANGLSQAK